MTINLIPPQARKERRTKQLLSSLYFAASAILIFLVLISGLIFATNYFVLSDIQNLDKKISAKTDEAAKYKELETSIRQTNQKISIIKKTDAERIIWSEVISEIAASTPAKIKLNSLSLNKDTKTTSMSGTAETRKDIADMKDELENSILFKNVTFTSSAYNSANKNYTFTLDAEMEGV
ncbi:MAG: PilN domain-containing protein [bacterium]